MPDEILTGDAGSPTPTPAPSAPAAPTPSAAPAAYTAPSPAPATPGAAPAEPPPGYVPSFRLRETTERYNTERQQWQTQQAQQAEQLSQLQRQRDALLGIAPPPDPNAQAVKQQFAQLFPTLAKFEERGIDPEQINAMLQRAQDIEAQQQHYWQSYGRQTMDRLFERASSTMNAPLSDQAKGALHSAFVGYVQSSPELVQRYATDPTLIDEFWHAFSSAFIEPARRVAATNVADRANVPLPRDSSQGAPIRVTPAPPMSSIDDRVAAAWTQYQATAKK